MLTIVSGVLLVYLGNDAEVLAISTTPPAVIEAGQPFEMDLYIKNTTDSEQRIVSLGLERELYNHEVMIMRTLPGYSRIENDNYLNWIEYTYDIRRRPVIPPGETLRLPVTFIAQQPGDFSGELVIWIENTFRNDYLELEITILPATAPWLGG